MRTLKKMLSVLLLLALSQIPIPAWGAENCTVTLPEFKVTINGEKFDNSYSKYPLLLYKDITYFPLTYYDCRLLGVSTLYDQQNGLALIKDDSGYSEYLRELTSQKNAKQQTAQIAQGPITIGGQTIDNAKEEYPFLLFRNVTYMPLTWKYAVDEFGWQYSFDLTNGLVITGEAELTATEPKIYVGDYAGLMGSGDRQFLFDVLWYGYAFSLSGVDFKHEDWERGIDSLDFFSVSIYNPDGDAYIYPIEPMEYRVYRKLNGKEHLIYKTKMSLYSGELLSSDAAHHQLNISFWDSEYAEPGEYIIRVTHPDNFIFSEKGSDEKIVIPFDRSWEGNDRFFRFEAPVRVVK